VKTGQPLTGKALEESKKLILGEYFHSGYRAATVRWRTKITPDGAATVIFELDPGAASLTGPVTITGLKHTRESVVRSRLRFKAGDPLDPRSLDETRTALYRSGVFDHVTITAPEAPPDAQAPTAVPVAVAVGERPRFEIGASLGYDSEEGLRETLQVGDNNFLGRAHYLSLALKHSDLEQRYDLSYRDPNLFGLNLDLIGTARYQFQRTDSFDLYRRGVDLRFTRILNPRLSLQAIAALTRVNFGEIRVDPTFQQLRQFSVPSLGVAIIYNSRDEALTRTAATCSRSVCSSRRPCWAAATPASRN
jgi:outer membrane protein assembly factor BamA